MSAAPDTEERFAISIVSTSTHTLTIIKADFVTVNRTVGVDQGPSDQLVTMEPAEPNGSS
jgi:hypothetical protein